ncbi:MAG: hypothetical protein Q9170_007315 [Blastenia crenularia]
MLDSYYDHLVGADDTLHSDTKYCNFEGLRMLIRIDFLIEQSMDGPRILVLIFILLILFASPDTQTPSPSQQHELDHLVLRERHALTLLTDSGYGDLNAAENRWINVTGLRKQDNYAWELLPKVQERARQQASTITKAWHMSKQDEEPHGKAHDKARTNTTSPGVTTVAPTPLYQNVTGIVLGHWVRSLVAHEARVPVLNLTTLLPGVTYTTDKYNRNITGLEGGVRFRLDEKQSQLMPFEDVSVREITAELTLEDDSADGDGWDMTLHGVHYPQDGSIVLTTTGQRFAGIFALPHFMLSNQSFASARHLLNKTLGAAIKTQESALETNALSPWSSSPQGTSDLFFPTPHCEYIVYLQQHPVNTAPINIESVETELRDPTGRLDLSYPPIKMSSLIFSPDCGFVLESKGPPDFAPQHGQHLQGPKLESYIRSSRRAILAFAVVVCAQLSLLLRQMRDASTPSTRSRISFYTISLMAMGDGFSHTSFLVISLFFDAAFLPLVATAFLCFVSISFFGMKFSMDIWTVQFPERDESRRQQERRDAFTASIAATPARADPLPLPVTATHVASANPSNQQTQGPPEGDQNPTNTEPVAQTTPGDTGRRELSALYTRFYLILLVLLFLTLYSMTWPSLLRTIYIRLLSVAYLSFYIPQIYRNIMRNCRKALLWRFVVGQSILRILPMAYLYLYQDNVLFIEKDSNWTIALVGWSWLQVWMLISQELFGPRFFVPNVCSKWIPVAYDYHPILQEEDEEYGASFPIGFTHAATPSPTAAASSSSTSNALGSRKGTDNGKGKKLFDCAICMQSLEVPVVRRDAEGGNIGTAIPGIGVGVKDLVFGRRAYMVTPCRHIFHSVCLEGWMRYRLQCPICRDNLPPLVHHSTLFNTSPFVDKSYKLPHSAHHAMLLELEPHVFGTSFHEMLRLTIVLALIYSTNTNPFTLNVTKMATPLHEEILPNPYHIPDSSIVLDFYHQAFGHTVTRGVIVGLLDKTRANIISHLVGDGNVPIAPGSHQVRFQTEVFVYESTGQERVMTYGEVLAVIRGFVTKVNTDGFRHRLATVFFKDGGGRMIQTGEAGLLEKVIAVDSV